LSTVICIAMLTSVAADPYAGRSLAERNARADVRAVRARDDIDVRVDIAIAVQRTSTASVSTNGCFVNDIPIAKSVLRDCDALKIGNVTFESPALSKLRAVCTWKE
jgi:hypothetical protein